MEKFRYSRLDKIYSSKKELIEKFNTLSRYFGETVAGRYLDDSGKTCIILVVFKSTDIGDYDIHFDTHEDSNKALIISKQGNESDLDAISRTYIEQKPRQGDYVFIKDQQTGQEAIYIYDSEKWISLIKVFNVIGTSSPSLDLSVKELDGTFTITGKVLTIDGGFLKDLEE